jgi:hypothetical protein
MYWYTLLSLLGILISRLSHSHFSWHLFYSSSVIKILFGYKLWSFLCDAFILFLLSLSRWRGTCLCWWKVLKNRKFHPFSILLYHFCFTYFWFMVTPSNTLLLHTPIIVGHIIHFFNSFYLQPVSSV